MDLGDWADSAIYNITNGANLRVLMFQILTLTTMISLSTATGQMLALNFDVLHVTVQSLKLYK